jgi:hypothetical protein
MSQVQSAKPKYSAKPIEDYVARAKVEKCRGSGVKST